MISCILFWLSVCRLPVCVSVFIFSENFHAVAHHKATDYVSLSTSVASWMMRNQQVQWTHPVSTFMLTHVCAGRIEFLRIEISDHFHLSKRFQHRLCPIVIEAKNFSLRDTFFRSWHSFVHFLSFVDHFAVVILSICSQLFYSPCFYFN